MKQLKYVVGLVAVSIIWGGTFPLVKVAISYISPFGFIALRFVLGTSLLFAFYFKNVKHNTNVLKPSVILGVFLFLGYAFQTVGLRYTSSSNAGFITGLYVVFTPIFSYFTVKEKITWKVATALLMSVTGLYMLSGVSGFNFGDALELMCAIAYGVHVALIAKFSREYDAATLTIFQLFFVFLFSSFFWGGEGFTISVSPLLIFGILFTGIFATAIGILVQVHAQRHIPPSRAAIIFTTEPVFAGIFSYVFLGEIFGFLGMIGATLILTAMLLASSDKESLAFD